MNRFNMPGLLILRWVFVAMFVLIVVGSLRPGLHVGADQFYVLLITSVLAAAAVSAQNPASARWISLGIFTFTVGILRLLYAFNEYSVYAAAIWSLAVIAVVTIRRYAIATPDLALQPMCRKAVTQPAHHSEEPVRPNYSFTRNIRRARYSFDDLVGMADTKKRLFAAGESIIDRPGEGRNGILLFGEPGNGKTMFAEALSGELNVPFFPVTYGDVASKWINETPQKLDAVFRQAREAAPCILFLDEMDSMVKPRESSHAMDRDLVNVMLTNIADLHGTQVVLVAATNFIDSLDPAAIREGRFDFRVEIPPPDLDARRAILRRSIGNAVGYGMVDSRLITSLAARWEGFSASRLAGVGGPLADMQRDGVIGPGRVTFDHGMRAMRMLQGRCGRLPEDVKSLDEIIMPPASRNALRDLAFRMKQIHRLEQIGGGLPTGLVFFGPPGTGKTQAAMALAKTSGYAFLKTTGANIIGKPESWDKLVREGKDIRPVVILIDEADDILVDRRYSSVVSLTNRILTTLDGADGRIADVIYIAATNHYDRLDSAAIRGGRFEEKIRFDVPSFQDLRQYIITSLKKISDQRYTIVSGVTERCLSIFTGHSISDVDAVFSRAINFAAVRALQENVAELRPTDISAAAEIVLID
ncbi:AAA family ATPase [Burkholderia sp. Ac-20365]|uniref:AAA family ATPase n=1 Tax=Burkholderia sp. Ac-20365 TaxID=2703897 RepID=UPI00197C1A03|nr:AAA family ATPase [Burkholderia sp. Ac-20365]MBN3760787.1 AAA family ATPase [Burkholderia sp. Ac-20365]